MGQPGQPFRRVVGASAGAECRRRRFPLEKNHREGSEAGTLRGRPRHPPHVAVEVRSIQPTA
jgi:hypothetical protein